MTDVPGRWDDLRPFAHTISPGDQVLVIAAMGGAKSTLVATLTLGVDTLVAIDGKGALRLPRSRIVELPKYPGNPEARAAWERDMRRALDYRDGREPDRVVIRPHVLDIDGFDVHDAIFHAVYDRRGTFLWIDEIGATGATPARVQPWLRALATRGRTRPVSVWTCSQSAFGLVPAIMRRNATYTIFGPIEPWDARDIPYRGIDIATTLPRKRGRFIVYVAGERDPYRLYLPIPPALHTWKAP
jgi:hypothetical protein